MANLRFEITGLDDLKSKIQNAANELPRNAGAALYQFAEDVMSVSKDERVPVDTGRLMNSGYVALPQQEGNVISVTMGYGTDYALKVHEDMDAHVHWKRPGSGPKFLENPLKESEANLAPVVGDAVKQTLAA
jgi:hypothetical protein